MSNKNKNKDGIVYSTNPSFQSEPQQPEYTTSLPPKQQQLRVMLDKKQRAGKKVTLVTGYAGPEKDLEALGKMLKTKCGVGGTVKEGQIMIQGDFREKIIQLLTAMEYKVKQVGG